MHRTKTIGFLGLGAMGTAIAEGIHGGLPEISLCGYDPRLPSGEGHGPKDLKTLPSAHAVEEESDLVFLCVKPADLQQLCATLQGGKAYVSIAAGVTTEQIRDYLPGTTIGQIARAMPNLSAQVARSATAVYCADGALRDRVSALFAKVGYVLPLEKEALMHAVTGLSGSGPAFVFGFIHALAEGGTAEGLTYAQSLELAAQTVLGATQLLLASGEHPGTLRNRVTSPAGTTIAGLEVLESRAFHGTVLSAVRAAAARSRELGR